MSQPDYGPLDRMLHRLALGPKFVRQASFDMEAMTVQKASLPEIVHPVFIAGLARSGSTILLNALYQTGRFRSLTYRDMPFVLMPGLWKKMSSSSRIEREARERAHGDRLLVEYDSPEAFEEVFWRTFCGDKYISADRVVPHNPSKSARNNFRQYVGHIINSRDQDTRTRYLAKNNNNLLRLPALKRVFPDALILIPFRAPLQHALSLLKQHQHFCSVHASDRFSMQYMNWLGHFEFGMGQKHYAYGQKDNPFDPMDVNYWLRCWMDAYNFALESAPRDAIFLGYEQLCADPAGVFGALYPKLHLDVAPDAAAASYEIAPQRPCAEAATELLQACEETHQRLLERHRQL